MFSKVEGKLNKLSEPQVFDVVTLRAGAMPTDSFEQISSFWRQYEKTAKRASAIQTSVSDALKKIASMNTVTAPIRVINSIIPLPPSI